jgi:catechol 2,3-dioxygenase-like lactoylglutathione lyase family enzyme
MTVERPIDHLVLAVHDLAAAQDWYTRLGFTLTPKALHPFGTANSLVQLQGNFLELLMVADRGVIKSPAPGNFSFARFNERFLQAREGMSMLVFVSDDARRDQAAFAESGLQTYAPFDFSRLAKLPDGSEVTVGFSLAFVTDTRMPQAAFFVCQQHAPQYFWKAEYQRHPNGAQTVAEIVMVAAEPASLAEHYAKLQPDGTVVHDGAGLSVSTSRGAITVLDPDAYAARFDERPPGPVTPHFAAYRIAVRDLALAEALLREGSVPYGRWSGGLRIGSGDNFGTALEFTAG